MVLTFVCPRGSFGEIPTPTVMALGGRAFARCSGRASGALRGETSALTLEVREGTLALPAVGGGGDQEKSATQNRAPPATLAGWSLTFHLVCPVLLQQLQWTTVTASH